MMVLRKKILALAGGLLALSIGRSASAIIIATGPTGGGTTALWDGVGSFTSTNGSFDPGSGALIDSTHVLTAAHLFFGTSGNTFSFNINGTSYPVLDTNIHINPSYTGGGSTALTQDRYDVAVITLATPVVGTTTYAYNHGSLNESTAGAATLVGYGLGGDGTNGESGSFGTKRQGNNAISLVTTNVAGTPVTDGRGQSATLPPGVIAWDFNRNDGTTGPFGDTAVGATEGDAAHGDSGGPVFQFDPVSGKNIITGVIIDGTDQLTRFGEISWATQTAAYSGFIASAVPEPTSLATVLLGGSLLLARRRAKP